jgi:hypothetical protein
VSFARRRLQSRNKIAASRPRSRIQRHCRRPVMLACHRMHRLGRECRIGSAINRLQDNQLPL